MFVPAPWSGSLDLSHVPNFITRRFHRWRFSQTTVNAAIYQQRLAGDVGGALRSQPDNAIGNFFRISKALNGGFRSPALVDLVRRNARCQGTGSSQLLEPVRGRISGGNVVD